MTRPRNVITSALNQLAVVSNRGSFSDWGLRIRPRYWTGKPTLAGDDSENPKDYRLIDNKRWWRAI